MKLDKEEAFADPTGLNPDESNQCSDEDMDTDEKEVADSVEGADPVENEESDEKGNHEEENTNATDETMGEAEAEQVGGSPERDDPGRDHEENVEKNLTKPSNDMFKPGISDHVPNAESATQPKGDSQAPDSRNIAPQSNWSRGNDAQNDFAPLKGLPSTNTTEMDMILRWLTHQIVGDLLTTNQKVSYLNMNLHLLKKPKLILTGMLGMHLKSGKKESKCLLIFRQTIESHKMRSRMQMKMNMDLCPNLRKGQHRPWDLQHLSRLTEMSMEISWMNI